MYSFGTVLCKLIALLSYDYSKIVIPAIRLLILVELSDVSQRSCPKIPCRNDLVQL